MHARPLLCSLRQKQDVVSSDKTVIPLRFCDFTCVNRKKKTRSKKYIICNLMFSAIQTTIKAIPRTLCSSCETVEICCVAAERLCARLLTPIIKELSPKRVLEFALFFSNLQFSTCDWLIFYMFFIPKNKDEGLIYNSDYFGAMDPSFQYVTDPWSITTWNPSSS